MIISTEVKKIIFVRNGKHMFDFAGEFEPFVNMVFLGVTGFIAIKAIKTRNPDGEADFVHLLFGCIAAVFFFLTLFRDVLGVFRF